MLVATLALSGVVVFLLGVLVGRAGREEAPTTGAPESPAEAASPETPSPLVIANPGTGAAPTGNAASSAPPLTSEGQILAVAGQRVVAAVEGTACAAIITPGRLGTCGIADMAGGRVIWVVESVPAGGGQGRTASIFTYVPSAGGWVERLVASDPQGEEWSDVRVLSADLTGDGSPEILAGFHFQGPAAALGYDVVVYPSGDVPRVAAHPGEAPRGSVTVAAGTIQEYAAQYPNDEPVCCPPFFRLRTIRFVDGFFRVVLEDQVPPTSVPPSSL